jgi:hypothetical protein
MLYRDIICVKISQWVSISKEKEYVSCDNWLK